MKKHFALLSVLLLCVTTPSLAQENGNLQIHFMYVGQGDGAVLISPHGETVLFDNGVRNKCARPIGYLEQLGVTKIDYHVASHYHDDHIGCTVKVLNEFPLQKLAFDRGGTYNSQTFRDYKKKVGSKRRTATVGQTITLDAGTANTVRIRFVALNGNGVPIKDENDRSVVAVVSFGRFDAVIGGDLSGVDGGGYKDVETSVVNSVGQVEVYKVNHHGSEYSTNPLWISTIKPRVGIISVGTDRVHGHPTKDCLKRLRDAKVKTYWTHSGTGAPPKSGWDIVGGHIRVEVAPNASKFKVLYNGETDEDSYSVWSGGGVVPFAPPVETLTDSPEDATDAAEADPTPTFSWSKRSDVYHYSSCVFIHHITPNNLETGDAAPAGKTLHKGCPT